MTICERWGISPSYAQRLVRLRNTRKPPKNISDAYAHKIAFTKGSLAEVAAVYGIAESTVMRARRAYGVRIREPNNKPRAERRDQVCALFYFPFREAAPVRAGR